MSIHQEVQPVQPGELRREVITLRPATTTREPIRLTITQRVTDENEIAMSTTLISGNVPVYFEKPDLLEDLGKAYFVAAYIMRKWNKNVK